jgi:hypothetical protein
MHHKLVLRAGVLAVAIAAATSPARAQTCSITSTAASPSPCTITSTHSLTMPSLLLLTMAGFTSGTSVTLAAPSSMADFSSGNTIQVPTTGPTFTVKSNRAYKVQISAATASFTGTTYAKPASDLAWSTSAAGTFTPLSTTAADVDAGSATTGSASVGLFYKTTYDFVQDIPGTYSLDVKFTLVAP